MSHTYRLRPLVFLPLFAGIVACAGPEAGKPALTGLTPAGEMAAGMPTYVNAAQRGPTLIVIPGDINLPAAEAAPPLAEKLADYAEAELARANFRVLERADFGALQQEFARAFVNRDDRVAARLLHKGNFRAARWVVKFDLAQAERQGDAWRLLMRYRIYNARTTAELASGSAEERFSANPADAGVAASGMRLLVGKAVAQIDRQYKGGVIDQGSRASGVRSPAG